MWSCTFYIFKWKTENNSFLMFLSDFDSTHIRTLSSTSLCRSTLRTWRRSPGSWFQPECHWTKLSSSPLLLFTSWPGRRSVCRKVTLPHSFIVTLIHFYTQGLQKSQVTLYISSRMSSQSPQLCSRTVCPGLCPGSWSVWCRRPGPLDTHAERWTGGQS